MKTNNLATSFIIHQYPNHSNTKNARGYKKQHRQEKVKGIWGRHEVTIIRTRSVAILSPKDTS